MSSAVAILESLFYNRLKVDFFTKISIICNLYIIYIIPIIVYIGIEAIKFLNILIHPVPMKGYL